MSPIFRDDRLENGGNFNDLRWAFGNAFLLVLFSHVAYFHSVAHHVRSFGARP
ncbi:MAG: hypothetical protein JWM95_1160 [Gemmatimonadetes bacterium]|nr:hypothetical protein [Gemmatimonadota bacterium]